MYEERAVMCRAHMQIIHTILRTYELSAHLYMAVCLVVKFIQQKIALYGCFLLVKFSNKRLPYMAVFF